MKKFNRRSKFIIILMILIVFCLSACVPYTPQPSLSPSTPSQPQPPPQETLPSNDENNPPVIHIVQAQREVAPFSNVQITCVASDEDGDELFYSWSSDTGSFKGQGKTITWIAPKNLGEYTIHVTVNDGRGKENRDSATIKVSPIVNQPPSISIIITPKGESPTSFTSESKPLEVREWGVLEIECIATDPDGDKLDYSWIVTEGKIDGDGAKVSYIAKGRGNQIITVTVTDETGREATDKIYLRVRCCGG